jgi:hypothetical protein
MMKKIILLFFISFYVNAQDYTKLFNSLDSVQKSQAFSHLRKIKKLINYEIIKQDFKIKEKEFIKGVLFIDNQGKFSFIITDEKSKKYDEIISRIISKLPLSYCSNYYNEYVSFRFKLNEINNLEEFYNDLMEENKEDNNKNDKTFSELSTFPAFKKNKFIDDKDKAIEVFYNSMNKHIKNNLNYPEKAMNENIQGKTNVTFLISSEGNVDEIYACKAHPILQLEGVRLIELLPKLIPGTINGKKIAVFYDQPFNFKLQ